MLIDTLRHEKRRDPAGVQFTSRVVDRWYRDTNQSWKAIWVLRQRWGWIRVSHYFAYLCLLWLLIKCL